MNSDGLWNALARAVRAEREACAKVCDAEAAKWEGDGMAESMSRICAAAIRARGQTKCEHGEKP